ncbi:MAG TPA: pyruvate:ferredoxin (flavodoxin) oxidoreductase, partial [Actinomycetota bacterium]|nr:pyruvate:ferredoxin (flavodoxin) oxidoreductase [Actinomycetota bacterium]
RPFPTEALVSALPRTVTKLAVLDRTKEPGAVGEPLYQDVVTALREGAPGTRPATVVGGRYGLSSKEFTPAMVAGVFRELEADAPKNHFTVGIVDDVTHRSLDFDPSFRTDTSAVRAVFYGLGSDGTVGANKSSVKIVGDSTDLFPQGYFVYDSKKSGSVTVSHLRFDLRPISSTYLIQDATFVACHQFGFLRKMDVLGVAARGATFLLNSPYDAETVWHHLPLDVQEEILAKGLRFYVIDARKVAAEVGMGSRINTVMQPCFFALSGILPEDEAIAAIKKSIEESYGKRGAAVVEQNMAAVDRSLDALQQVAVPAAVTATVRRAPIEMPGAGDLVQGAIAKMLAGEGDQLPVSALPVDGTFPTATARYEKRSIAAEIPIWDPDICIDCGHCAIVCPHAAILMKVYDPAALEGAPAGFRSKDFHSKEVEGARMTIQVAPDDCTACGICVDVCPAKSKTEVKHKAIEMQPVEAHRVVERESFDFFRSMTSIAKGILDPATVKGSQAREPLFEFSGACAGCGETPYLKLLTQLFGDRMVVANATGCSSIYGGNLPTTPWSVDREGRGPAWANSLFEDNAEFGLGMRLSLEKRAEYARKLLDRMRPELDPQLVDSILAADHVGERALDAQRVRVDRLKDTLTHPSLRDSEDARELLGVADDLVDRSLWIIGGDGWAYDIGSAGLDHVLASGRNVNVLVLDTEVYSNTGGQASKATPRGAVAKFATAGKASAKKDLGMIAAQYGNVYVAQVSLGANYAQTIKAFMEAEAWPGPSLIIAYSTCIAHGIDMTTSMSHQKDAVRSGYWPLFRYQPGSAEHEH